MKLYDNNVSTTINKLMDKVAGKPEFGDTWANKKVQTSEVPAEFRGIVQAATNGADSFETGALHRRLSTACTVIMAEDKGFLGVFPGNHEIEPKEAERASQKDPVAKALIDYLNQD